jgi:glutathione S-transferase
MSQPLTLISHALCPYVQRASIALGEKAVAFERVYVDLANKPAWFEALSPLGKTPVLKVGNTAIFESAVISNTSRTPNRRPCTPPIRCGVPSTAH